MIVRRHRPRRLVAAGAVLLLGAGLAACSTSGTNGAGPSGTGSSQGAGGGSDGQEQDGGAEPVVEEDAPPAPVVTMNVDRGAESVPVSTLLEVDTDAGSLTGVTVTSEAGDVAGEIADDGGSWTASDRLEPGVTYMVKAVADNEGEMTRQRSSFTTEALTLDDQTYPSVAPLDGETVGVGMPVIVTFDLPVTDRAAFEKQMTVTSQPAQAGSWHWLNGNEAHWRPKAYWKPGTRVSVDVDINGVDAGDGIYGQENRNVDFKVGDAHVYKVDMVSHQMKVLSNGELLRTIPITTGEQPTYTTRSGTKVIIEKFETKDMNSETVGITGAEAYNIQDVQYAMRLTYSGEFIHAAPWSVGSQGYDNVSHGCTGMSTENAGWLFAMSRRGDVVEYTGSDRPMTFDNGYGDWNESFPEYQQGSAVRR